MEIHGEDLSGKFKININRTRSREGAEKSLI
jgi:hypothetical protein